MKHVPVHAELLAPVVIRRDRQSERSESMRFVAGTLVRGSLASIYLQQHGQPDDTFRRLFLDEAACRFGPLDPGPRVFPLTAASCKREGLRHALADQLWLRVAQHHMGGRVSEDADAAWRRCAQCAADLKAQEGFWRGDCTRLRETKSDRHHMAAHVGIDRCTGTAAESILYTLEALAPSGNEADLHGWIRADDDALDALEQLLQEEDSRISIGRARTRGYGDMRLRLSDPVPAEDWPSAADRWNRWSRDLSDLLGSPPFCVPHLAPDDFYFALSFPNGAVIVDRFLRYTLDPADMIGWLPPMPTVAHAFPMQNRPVRQLESGGAVRWVAAVTRHERLRGWNAAHGLPRQDEWAIARGATYVYRFEGAPGERDALNERLATLDDGGVGLRRNEGFGVVSVCDEFHRRFRQQEAQR